MQNKTSFFLIYSKPQLLQPLTISHFKIMRIPDLLQILKEPSLSFVNHAGLVPLLSLALVCQIRNILTFGLTVQIVQFSICVVLHIFWIYIVDYFMSWRRALSRVGLFGRVETKRRAGGCRGGENGR